MNSLSDLIKRGFALLPILLPSSALAQAGVYDHRGLAGDEFGGSLAAVGDVDGDGRVDYAVGAPHGMGLQPDAGYVLLFSGRTGATLWRLDGAASGDLFGWSLAGLGGDVDGDQLNDLIVGAPGASAGGGKVFVCSGADGSTLGSWFGSAGTQAGWSVSAIGDVDGDSVVDYAFSLPAWSSNRGIVTIASGASNSYVRDYLGQLPGDQFGYALDAAGDVNGDGRGDLVVGAPGYDRVSGVYTYPNAGRAYVVSGGTQQTLYHYTGWVGLSAAGKAVAGGEDLDGDGVPDIAVGLPDMYVSGPLSGRVDAVSGAGAHAVLFQVAGAAGGDHFGASLDLIPDANGDGLGDLVVGAPDADVGPLADAGYGYVLSGLDGSELYRMNGYQAGDRMGAAVASADLLNADGAGDVLFGAPNADHSSLGIDSGWARSVLSAAPNAQQYCLAKVNSAGCTPSIGSAGVASLSVGDNYHILAQGVLPSRPGMLIWSLALQSTPFYGGTLCVKAPIKRTALQSAAQVGPGPCDGYYDYHLSHDYMNKQGITPGSSVHAQYWSRDSGFAPPNAIGLTGGLEITVFP